MNTLEDYKAWKTKSHDGANSSRVNEWLRNEPTTPVKYTEHATGDALILVICITYGGALLVGLGLSKLLGPGGWRTFATIVATIIAAPFMGIASAFVADFLQPGFATEMAKSGISNGVTAAIGVPILVWYARRQRPRATSS